MDQQTASLFELIDKMEASRDTRVMQILSALAHHDGETLRLALEALFEDYPQEIREILAEHVDEDYQEADLENVVHHDEYVEDEFEDAAYYNNDFVFEEAELEYEQDIEQILQLLLENPAAINSLIMWLLENPQLDLHLIEAFAKHNPELEQYIASDAR